MSQYGSWIPYIGGDALLLAVVLLIIAGVLAYSGTRLHRSIGVRRPGKAVGAALVVIWALSLADFIVAVIVYVDSLYQQHGPINAPKDPISRFTYSFALITFFTIAYLSRHHGLKIALGSAIVGAIAAPMLFELPFDLIVMGRTFPPSPARMFTLLFFLPLFLWEISSFALLAVSPLTRISKYTLFSLAAMFLVFAIWALFGFWYPLRPLPFVLNVISKALCFVAAITLFVPQRDAVGYPIDVDAHALS